MQTAFCAQPDSKLINNDLMAQTHTLPYHPFFHCVSSRHWRKIKVTPQAEYKEEKLYFC